MQFSRMTLAALLLHAVSCTAVGREGAAVTPVEKVIELLADMLAKGQEEKHAEEVQYATYKQFCEDMDVEKTRAIEQAANEIERLEAHIEKAEATASELSSEVSQHQAEIVTAQGEKESATTVRHNESEHYSATHQDYTESIDALERAINKLKSQDYDRSQATALAEVAALQTMKLIPRPAKRSLELFLGQGMQAQEPEAYAYEFQSGSIIDILEGLLDKFRDERTELEKEETNARHSYDLIMQDLTAQIDQDTKDVSSKTETIAKQANTKAQSEGTLTETHATKAADETYLSDLQTTCASKASDFGDRQQLREDEIKSIQDALEILNSDEIKGHAETYLPTMLQRGNCSNHTQLAEHAVLASLRATLHIDGDNEERAHEFLVEQAQKLHSQALATLASKVSSGDPFADVRKLIEDLIVRLQEEAGEEATHKSWCDSELATNEQTRHDKSNNVDKLHSEIDALEASTTQLSTELATLSEEVNDMDVAMAAATEYRNTEKASNEETIKDSQDAQEAVTRAMVLLREFYGSASSAAALLQQEQDPLAPEIFSDPYTGMQTESGSVLHLLEVVEADFARLEADVTASEAVASEEYKKFMSDSEIDKAVKNTDIEHKTQSKQHDEQTLSATKTDLDDTQKELDAALAYYDKLKPSCVDSGVSFEERVARREEEIQSLQEALRILEGEFE